MRRTQLALGLCLLAASASGLTYTVTTTADSGAGSLRQAILDANTNPGADTIQFNIVGSAVQTITPATPLPPITDAVTIDGYTQPGASENTQAVGQGLDTVLLIEIDGSAAPGPGFNVQGSDVTIRGLAINRFTQGGVDGSGANLVVEGCFVNTSADGLTHLPGGNGVWMQGPNSPNSRVGGLTPAQRNLIASPTLGAAVNLAGLGTIVAQGNLVGTDVTGERALGAVVTGVTGVGCSGDSGAKTIGGSNPNAGNVIAGVDRGINMSNALCVVQGNTIGVGASHQATIQSGEVGILVNQGSAIGGDGPGEGNVIGGFLYGLVFDNDTLFQGNFVGTDPTGTKSLGNRSIGVVVSTGGLAVGGIGAGEGNVIANNGWVGVIVDGQSQNPIRGNRIYGNGVGGVGTGGLAMGIDLHFSATPGGPTANDLGDGDAGANERQNHPILSSAVPEGGGTRVIGTLNSLASTVFDLDFYSNPGCRDRPRNLPQAEVYLGSAQVTTDGSGNTAINALLPTPIQAGDPVTATATDPNGNTSELSPGIAFVLSQGVGGPGDTSLQGLSGQLFDPAATVTVGGNPVTATVESATLIRFVGPSLAPGGVYDVTVTNPGGLSGTIQNAYVSRFNDVPDANLFDDAISRLVAGEITVGIGGGNYGPSNNVTRQQMAVFVLKAKYGVCYTPPPCVQVFDDVPCGSNFAVWVNQFAAEGITGGCGGNNFCPVNPVRRDQMAVFLLKGKYGANFTPPPCTGVFQDVVCPSTFAAWIERLAAEGITGGCGGNNYCPLNNNTRAQMAAFIVRTFTLP